MTNFDKLIKDREFTKALRVFATEGYTEGEFGFTRKQLIEYAADKIEESEIYIDENSKKNAVLNEFLQERNTTATLGMHVVDAVMQYVQELEDLAHLNAKKVQALTQQNDKNIKQNERYRKVMKEAVEMSSCCGLTAGSMLSEALEEVKC